MYINKYNLIASPSANIAFWNASTKDSGEISELKAGYNHGKVLYAMLDGHSAYCMNYGLSAKGGQLMNSYPNSSTSMTAQQEKLLSYCLYYGYSSTSATEPSNDQSDQYIATQAMVWVIVANIFGTGNGDSAANKLCATAPDPSASYSYYESLRDKINGAYNATIPSFASRTKSGAKTYELKWNDANGRYEITLDDTNGVLSDFDFSISGFTVKRNGNSLTVSTKEVHTGSELGSAQSASGKVETTSSCVFWLTGNAKDREFVSERPTADPLPAYIKVKTEDIGYGELTKTDKSSGAKLAGAVYGIYSDSDCKNLVSTMTTDGNGYAKSGALTAGTYYVKEITAPSGYVLSDKVHTLTVKAGQTTGISATDKEQMGALTVYKEGKVLAGWDGSDFTYETRKLPGAVFKVTAGADIHAADGTKAYSKGDVVADNLVTGADGKAVLTDLHLGTYVVTETKSIDGFAINTEPKTVKIEYKDQTVKVQYEEATIKNSRQKASVSVTKKDSETKNPLARGKFTLYAGNDIKNYDGMVIVTKGSELQTVTTGADGKAAYTIDLPIANSYFIKETQAPFGYFRNSDETYEFTFEKLPETEKKATFSHTFLNDRTKAKIHLYKVDKESGLAVPQGDAKLSGAVYGLYARNDIVHPDGVTGVLYHAGDLVATLTTDDKGEAEVKGLYLGNYYVKETEPSEGYLLDGEEHDLVCDYEGDLVAEVSRTTTSKEQVIKQPFQLIKVSDNGDDTEAPLLKGAGFTAYLKSKLPVNADGSFDFASAEPVVIGEDGATTIYSDEKGHAVSIPIPYGTYVVIETVTPHNMDTIKPFEVKITENHPTEPQVWRVFIDREFTAKLRVVKIDGDTKKPVLIPDTEFRIYNLDKKEYVTMITTYPSKVTHKSFFTDEDGDLILPEALKIGNYRIEEVSAPFGYVVNENYFEVSVDTDTPYEVDPDTYEAVITVDYEDMPAVGELTVEKKGEILDAYKGGLFADPEDKAFVYKEGSLAGAKYEVYAAEDIYTADMQKDENGNRTKYYSEGDLVGTMTTEDDGKAVMKDLPLGRYKVVEVEAPYGYVLDSDVQFVTFTYVDDHTPVIHEKLTFTNDRQKLSLSVEKKDAEDKTAILGAVFGLYAAENIKNADGSVIIEEGTLLEKAVSNENGIVSFIKDYPFAKYTAKELERPAGYVTNEEVISFDTEYQGQDVKVAEYSSEYLNTPTTFEFTKEDITSSAELSGATLTVLDKDGNVVETWTSDADEPHVIKKLVVGETYILREEYAPYGYLKAADIEFTVEDTEKIQGVTMKDVVPNGTIIINKDGEFVTDITLIKGHWYDFVFNYFKKSLAGVTFDVYAAEDILSADGLGTVYFEKDELIDTIVTDDNGYAMIGELPLGKYYLVETKTLDGFVLDAAPIEVDLSYIDQDTPIVYAGMDVTNERVKVEISVTKKDAETDEVLEGAVFGLFAKEDILNSDGDIIVKAGEEIERAVSGKDGKATFVSDLPLGKYYVKETEAPKGYATTEEEFDIDASYQGDDVPVLCFEAEFKDRPTKVEFSKTDVTGEFELIGAKLSIIDSEGKVIESWTSEGTPHMVEKLPAGSYTLREETAPYGYRIANDVTFDVADTGDIQKVSMKDELVNGKIVIEKKDEDTKKGIDGVEFEIRDEQGNVIEKLITDANGHAESKELPIAVFKDGNYEADIRYTVVETKAADGYILDGTPHEVVLCYDGDAPETVTYGIPAEEIAFIHDANSDAQREALFKDMRTGKKKVLIGSTDKCGTGVNVQTHLVAMHHVDCPWKPSSIEQREGRGIRQGNENEEIAVYRYVTKGTFDAYNWSLVENKQRFISQVMTSRSISRTCEDIGEATLSYAEIKAVATGNPLIREKMEIDNEVQRLRLLKSTYDNQRYSLQDSFMIKFPKLIAAAKEKLSCVREDIRTRDTELAKTEDFSITVGKATYTERMDGGTAMLKAVSTAKTGETTSIGSFRGFELLVEKNFMGINYLILHGKADYKSELSASPVGNMVKLENTFNGIHENEDFLVKKIEQYERDMESAKAEYEKPFQYDRELREKVARQTELNAQLDLENKVPEEEIEKHGPQEIRSTVRSMPDSNDHYGHVTESIVAESGASYRIGEYHR